MKRALMYASVASMIQQFNMSNIKLLQELGYEVDVACNFEFGSTISNERIESLKKQLNEMNVHFYHVPIPRKITDLKNLKLSYKQTLKLMNERQYHLIHCHSPIGGVICREANKQSENYKNCRMIYTAHGFHFFKGNNPIKNFVFKNIEKNAAEYTDVLITINKEDYEAAKNFKLKENGKVEYIPGVGIDIEKINSIQGNKEDLCKELDIPNDSFLLLSVGELSKRKNHEVILNCLPYLDKNTHYLICGQGELKKYLEEKAKKLNVENRLHLLGYRSDIIEVMKACDVFLFPSLQEGLPVALMEAMASGLPCVASSIRGNVDLLEKENLVRNDNEWNDKIKLSRDREKINMSVFDKKNIEKQMIKVYIGDNNE